MEIQHFSLADFSTETSISQLNPPNLIHGQVDRNRFYVPCQSLIDRRGGHRVVTRFCMASHSNNTRRQRNCWTEMNCDENCHTVYPIKNRVKMRLTPSLRGCLC